MADGSYEKMETLMQSLVDKMTEMDEKIESSLRISLEAQQTARQALTGKAILVEGESSQNDAQNKPKGQPKLVNLEDEPNRVVNLTEEPILLASKIEALERTLKGIRRADDLVDIRSLSLFPQARIPQQFKMPDLEKFDGTNCPKAHLKMYARAMQPRGADDELMAQLFQESLTGSALRWFLSMDEAHVKTWEDVCNQFTDHYKYNNEV
ncbi:hypothetical protein HGI15_22120, partial [Modestobacter lapidis]|nr:hypothetical protein [Modestobacter lapidis]